MTNTLAACVIHSIRQHRRNQKSQPPPTAHRRMDRDVPRRGREFITMVAYSPSRHVLVCVASDRSAVD
eukprot:5525421-Prymnesium_polylepis.1